MLAHIVINVRIHQISGSLNRKLFLAERILTMQFAYGESNIQAHINPQTLLPHLSGHGVSFVLTQKRYTETPIQIHHRQVDTTTAADSGGKFSRTVRRETNNSVSGWSSFRSYIITYVHITGTN